MEETGGQAQTRWFNETKWDEGTTDAWANRTNINIEWIRYQYSCRDYARNANETVAIWNDEQRNSFEWIGFRSA